jgi:hypothetical protein
MRKKQVHSNIFQANKNSFVLFLLALFVLVNIPFASFHSLIHPYHEAEHSATHSEFNEQDACHRSIYHQDTQRGCGHKNHISKQESSCVWDKIFLVTDFYLSPENAFIFSSFQPVFAAISSEISFFSSTDLLCPPARGPPTMFF